MVPGFFVRSWKSPHLFHFLSIFELPYFTRVWVIQEVAVSRFAQVFCGQKSLSWDDLSLAVTMVEVFGSDQMESIRRLEMFNPISSASVNFQSQRQTKSPQNIGRAP